MKQSIREKLRVISNVSLADSVIISPKGHNDTIIHELSDLIFEEEPPTHLIT
jgi:hypothetical protein